MVKLEELNRKACALIQQSRDLQALAEKEDRELTGEELAQIEKCAEGVRELAPEQKKLRGQAAMFAELDQAEQEARAPQPRIVKPQPGPIDQGLNGKDSNGKLHVNGVEQKDQGFKSFTEQIAAVIHAGKVRDQEIAGPIDSRLLIQAASGLSEGVASEGGFLVQTDFAETFLERVYQIGQLASRVWRMPVGPNSNGLKINGLDETSRADGSRDGGILVYTAAEAEAKTATKPKFRQMELTLHKIIGACYLTDELLADTVALEAWINKKFAGAVGFKIDDLLLRGTGAGEIKGIFNSQCLVTITAETGQAAKTIVAENIEKMYARMWAPSIPNSAFFVNQDVWPQLFQLSHAVGTGGVPMFVPAGGLSQAPFGTLLGRPIVPIEHCETLGTKGDIIFADFGEMLLIDKGGIQAASSIHVRFMYDEQVLRFVYRVDAQPTWANKLTPYKGTATQSPFIVLESRT